MKKCNMCSSQLPDTYNACPNCGNTNLMIEQPMNNQQYGQPMNNQPMNNQQYGQPMMNNQPMNNQQYGQPMPGPMYNQQQAQQKGSFGWAILGFLIPIVGWILYFSWKNSKPGDAKMAGIGGIVGFCFNLLIQFL